MRIGTRGSKLAMWQASTVAQLIKHAGGPECEIVIIRTAGDESTTPPDPPRRSPDPADAATVRAHRPERLPAEGDDVSLKPSGQVTPDYPNVKRMFVKEIEDALLDGRIDLAVHSSKDLSADLPEGLVVAAALEREDPRDALLLPRGTRIADVEKLKRQLGPKPRIGTSSVRRVAQLRALFPSAEFVPIRGNVDTRLRKLDSGECDVIMLAAAGLKRLGVEHRISFFVPDDICVPAPGQGIVAVEIAETAPAAVKEAIKTIGDADAEAALIAERAVVRALGGGCQVPLGVLAQLDGQDLGIRGIVCSLDGSTNIRASARGHRGAAAAIGDKLAAQLLAKGAQKLLSNVGAD